MNETSRIIVEAMQWLKLNKCYKCKRNHTAACVYKIESKRNGEWKCYGYKRNWKL